MDLVLMIVVALAAALAGLAGVYLGMKIDGRRRRKLDTEVAMAGAAEAAAVLAAVIRPRHYVFGCVLFASYRFRRRDFLRGGRQI